MKIDHVAIWTNDIEILKDFYVKYFDGKANNKYQNTEKQFESYFIKFESGARLEIMTSTNIAEKTGASNIKIKGIAHIAFGMKSMEDVDNKALQFRNDGHPIVNGPRKTGDGYYEFTVFDPDQNIIEITAVSN